MLSKKMLQLTGMKKKSNTQQDPFPQSSSEFINKK